jgi:hypothetical protein
MSQVMKVLTIANSPCWTTRSSRTQRNAKPCANSVNDDDEGVCKQVPVGKNATIDCEDNAPVDGCDDERS